MPIQLSPALLRSGTLRPFAVLFGTWTLIVAGILGVTLYFSNHEEREIALNRAMDSYHKDLAYRKWVAERGGVYVPADEKTPPNPYLAGRPDRDVTTTTGRKLTLVNPAYMTRMVHELGAKAYGLQGHLTSLNPIRPENGPDAWERRALERLTLGQKDYAEVVSGPTGPMLRYMGVFLVEPSCLGCHAAQGYRVGDVRGGISVTVPLGSGPTRLGLSHKSSATYAILAFWVMGGMAIYFWVRRLMVAAEDQQRMLEEVDDSSRRFRQLFEASPAPMFIHRAGRIIEVNEAALRLIEAEAPADLINRPVLEMIHPDFRQAVEQRIRQLLASGQPTPAVEEIFITLKGREVWVEVQPTLLDLPGGPAVLVFAQDLTDRRSSDAERRRLEAEVQHTQKLESLGSLAGGIAHDMNNVLAAIMGMSSLLQMRHEEDASIVKSLRTIEKAATRGRDLVKGLTDFARKGLEQPKIMDLNALVQMELDLLVRTSRQRFTFEVDLDAELPAIMGEPSILGSAFMNLCVNAFDAMPKGGTLRIQTRRASGHVELVVADTGEGIPADILSRVTDPFFTTKPAGRGTGLGLAMVYGAMKAHGGILDIKSEVGHGTQITLRFPAVLVPLQSPEPMLPLAAGETRLQILLVDDDELVRSTLPQMLEQLGHQVETAASGLEAIRRLDAGLAADLVILDHNMPGMSGAETLPRILQLRPAARIILATGFLDTELKLLLAGFPAVHTLQKPFSMAELQQVLKAATAGLGG